MIASAVHASFLNLIYPMASTVVHLLLLKGSMAEPNPVFGSVCQTQKLITESRITGKTVELMIKFFSREKSFQRIYFLPKKLRTRNVYFSISTERMMACTPAKEDTKELQSNFIL